MVQKFTWLPFSSGNSKADWGEHPVKPEPKLLWVQPTVGEGECEAWFRSEPLTPSRTSGCSSLALYWPLTGLTLWQPSRLCPRLKIGEICPQYLWVCWALLKLLKASYLLSIFCILINWVISWNIGVYVLLLLYYTFPIKSSLKSSVGYVFRILLTCIVKARISNIFPHCRAETLCIRLCLFLSEEITPLQKQKQKS